MNQMAAQQLEVLESYIEDELWDLQQNNKTQSDALDILQTAAEQVKQGNTLDVDAIMELAEGYFYASGQEGLFTSTWFDVELMETLDA